MQTETRPQIAKALDTPQRVVIHGSDDQTIRPNPNCPAIESLLQFRTTAASTDAAHGYRLDRIRLPMLGTSANIANGGLAEVVAYMLLNSGYEVETRRPSIRRLATPLESGNPHVMDFICRRTHGLIQHNLSDERVADLCADIAQSLHDARIAFVAVKEQDVWQLHHDLSTHFGRVTLALPDRCEDPERRLTVSTIYGLGHPDVIGDPFDIVIFMDAGEAVCENGQLALRGQGRARLFGLLRHDRELAPRLQDLIMAMFGPRHVTVPRLGYQDRQVEVAWCQVKGGPQLPGRLTGFALHRRGIVGHELRNRRIAKLAEGIVQRDEKAVKRICPSAGPIVSNVSGTTAIIVDGIEHGLELARLLPDWMLITDREVNLTGLSTRLRSVHDHHRGSTFHPGVIVTTSGLGCVNLHQLGAVIWAGGGIGVPKLPANALMCSASEPYPLLWIDFHDAQHGELRRQSAKRRDAYLANDWFPIGELPVVGRIKRFLGDRPRGDL